MKIGILTFHEVCNPGAFLQALGTVTLLRSLGHDPYIIDYTPPAHRFSKLSILRNWRLWRHPIWIADLLGKQKAFATARETLPLTRRLHSHEELEQEMFDAVLIGADIVWDYETPRLGRDPVYFGHHLRASRLLTFAASCGPVSGEAKPPDYVVEGIKHLYAISVRDQNTQTMVQTHSNRRAHLICDPAFHLDIPALPPPQGVEDPYVLIYASPRSLNQDQINEIQMFAMKHGLKTKAVIYRHDWADDNRVCISPYEWWAYIQHAAETVVNTFHGTIFSILSQKRFATAMTPAVRHKLPDLLRYLGLESRIWREGVSLASVLEPSWSEFPVLERIETWRTQAREFVKENLEDGDVKS